MYFMSVKATFAVAARTRKVSRRPCTCPSTGNNLILHKTLLIHDFAKIPTELSKKGMLYILYYVSSPLDRSKRITLHSLVDLFIPVSRARSSPVPGVVAYGE